MLERKERMEMAQCYRLGPSPGGLVGSIVYRGYEDDDFLCRARIGHSRDRANLWHATTMLQCLGEMCSIIAPISTAIDHGSVLVLGARVCVCVRNEGV